MQEHIMDGCGEGDTAQQNFDNPTNGQDQTIHNDTAANHEWWVFSTCLGTCELMLICTQTDAFAVVPKPTAAEWQEAYWAPKQPYRWPESKRGRVVVKWPTGAHTLCHTPATCRLAQAFFTPSHATQLQR